MSEGGKSITYGQVPDTEKYKLELVGAIYPGYSAQHVSESEFGTTIYFPTCHPWDGQNEIREFAVNGTRFPLPRPLMITTGDQPFLNLKSITVDGSPISIADLMRIKAA